MKLSRCSICLKASIPVKLFSLLFMQMFSLNLIGSINVFVSGYEMDIDIALPKVLKFTFVRSVHFSCIKSLRKAFIVCVQVQCR